MSTIAPSNDPFCRGKLSYPSRAEAQRVRSEKQNYELNVYPCVGCGGFHLGRNPKARDTRPMVDVMSKKAKRLAKKASRGGRPRTEGPRYSDGHRKKETVMERQATVIGQRMRAHGMTKDEAKKAEAGTVIGRLSRNAPEYGGLSKEQVSAAEYIALTKASADAAIQAPRVRSSTDYVGPTGGGFALDDSAYEEWARGSIARWKEVRPVILHSGPLGMMAVETMVFENKDADSMIGDLRLALNAVHRYRSLARRLDGSPKG